jgi:hypothetical protein
MVNSVKWVDEVLEDVPYDVSESFMQTLFEARVQMLARQLRRRAASQRLRRSCAQKHNIDYIIHGDDPCLLPVRWHSSTRHGGCRTRGASADALPRSPGWQRCVCGGEEGGAVQGACRAPLRARSARSFSLRLCCPDNPRS